MFDALSGLQIFEILGIGLVAGLLGGMLGVGGSIIMIPGLTLLLGPDQHVYQAAAMIANVAVSVPATYRHRKAGVVMRPVLKWLLPSALAAILLGVWLSNRAVFAHSDGELTLRRLFALLLVYVVALNVYRLFRPEISEVPGSAAISPRRVGFVGVVMGLFAGLLGVGGGAISVPLQQVVLRLPLRNAIANSAAVICLTAGFGAVYKNATLPSHGASVGTSLSLAVLLTASGFLGGRAGASLTHRLPIRQVRVAFVILMAFAAWRMAELPWPTF